MGGCIRVSPIMKKKNGVNTNQLKRQVHENDFHRVFRDTGETNCIASRHLDPYGRGCYYNCSYCYGRSMLYSKNRWFPNNPGVSDINDIANAIKNELPSGSVVRLGGLTDCFQPLEKQKRMTYKTIKLLNRKGVHYLVITKSPLVASKEYLELYDPELAHFQVTLTSTDNTFLSKISKRAPRFEETRDTIETLYKEGLDTIIRLSPFFYEYMDYDKLNNIECDKILIEFLRVNNNVRKFLGKYMDLSEYNVKAGKGFSMEYLPLEKQIREIEQITGFKEVNVCNDLPEYDKYFRENYNCNSEFCCNLRGVTKKNAVGKQLWSR